MDSLLMEGPLLRIPRPKFSCSKTTEQHRSESSSHPASSVTDGATDHANNLSQDTCRTERLPAVLAPLNQVQNSQRTHQKLELQYHLSDKRISDAIDDRNIINSINKNVDTESFIIQAVEINIIETSKNEDDLLQDYPAEPPKDYFDDDFNINELVIEGDNINDGTVMTHNNNCEHTKENNNPCVE